MPGATLTAALGINDAGQISGEYLDAGGREHGYLLDGGRFTTIDAPGRANSITWGINGRGEIVIPEPGTGIFGLA